jgi:PAS domain S-box-containing protein
VSHSDDSELEAEAQAFEEEKTSPELRSRHAPRPLDDGVKPFAVVATPDARRRRRFVEVLRGDGWNALEAHDADEALELVLTVAPFVVIVDPDIRNDKNQSVPELVRQHRPDAALRSVAIIGIDNTAERIATALADGYDDFLTDLDNEIKLMTRASANLKAARNIAQLNKQRRDAALLLELTQTLGSSIDMQLILHTVSRLLAEVATLERCSIILLDPDDDEAIMVAASEDRTVRDLRIRISKYPEVQRCVETAAPVIIADTNTDPLLAGVSASLSERSVRAMALFPIVFEEQVTGVLFLRSSKAHRILTSHEVQFGQTVAAACAVAIRNARLFDQYRDQHQHMRTMQQQAERQSEALRKYQDFFEYAADGISVIDVDGRIHYVNKEGRRLLGRTRDELKSLDFRALLVEDSARRWSEVVDQVRLGRFQRSFDVYAVVNDEERVFSLSAGGVGQGTGLIILNFRDVTEMREMEGELRTTKEFLENLINSSVDAIVAADMNGNIMLFNKGAEKMYGYRAEDVIGRMHVTQLYPGMGAGEVMHRLRDPRWGGVGRLAPERREILTASGDVIPVSMSASIIYEDGEEVATVGVFTDLRDRMAIERQLSEARDQLTKAEKARVAAELAGMAAHELNQPLTSVLGYAEMLKARIPDSDVRLRRPVDTIFIQAERMAEIVRKIGRVTKYETKRYGANTDMIDLNRAVDDAAAMVTTPPVTLPTVATPSAFVGVGRHQARSEGAGDEEFTDPRGMRAAPSSSSSSPSPIAPSPSDQSKRPDPKSTTQLRPAGIMAALLGRPEAQPGTDPRAAVVRLDTVEDEPAGYARRLKTPPQGQPVAGPLPHEEAAVTGSFRPPLRAAQLDVPGGGDDDEHTNPGVKLSDLRKKARDVE